MSFYYFQYYLNYDFSENFKKRRRPKWSFNHKHLFLHSYTKLAESSFLCRFLIESVNVFVLPRFDLCHVLSSSTHNFAHAQTLSRMSSLSGRMNIARVNIGFFTGFKKIKQRRISFVLGYLDMILWKISTAISIKHRILATFNIKKIQFWQPVGLWCNRRMYTSITRVSDDHRSCQKLINYITNIKEISERYHCTQKLPDL
jgi:hypothetical protein